jgi:hypothetical protein
MTPVPIHPIRFMVGVVSEHGNEVLERPHARLVVLPGQSVRRLPIAASTRRSVSKTTFDLSVHPALPEGEAPPNSPFSARRWP